jgi:hypothetical protein
VESGEGGTAHAGEGVESCSIPIKEATEGLNDLYLAARSLVLRLVRIGKNGLTSLFVFGCVIESIALAAMNSTELLRRLAAGQWYIESRDARLTIIAQLFASLLAGGAGVCWYYGAMMRALHRNAWSDRTMYVLLGVASLGLALMLGTHRLYQMVICEKGTAPNGCGL